MKNYKKLILLSILSSCTIAHSMEEQQPLSLKRKRSEEQNRPRHNTSEKAQTYLDQNPYLIWKLLGKGDLTSNMIANLLQNFVQVSPLFELACNYINNTDLTIDKAPIEQELKTFVKDIKHKLNKILVINFTIELSRLITQDVARTPEQRKRAHVLIASGVLDLDYRFIDGTTLLIKALACDSVNTEDNNNLIRPLIENGADVNAGAESGHTPLMIAISQNNEMIATKLIKYGAEVNKNSRETHTALLLAWAHGMYTIIDLLIENGAHLDFIYNNGNTLLMLAIQKNDNRLATTLLEHNANPNIENKNKIRALDIAYKVDNQEMIIPLAKAIKKSRKRRCIEEGVKNDAPAKSEQCISTLWLLLNNESILNHQAISDLLKGQIDSLQSLKFIAACQLITLSDSAINEFFIPEELKDYIKNCKHKLAHTLHKRLLNELFELILQSKQLNTNQEERISSLIGSGALNLNSVKNDHKTAFMEAILQTNLSLTELFIKNGVNINFQNILGRSALMYACSDTDVDSQDAYEIVVKLIENGANINIQDYHGETSLIKACQFDFYEMAELLIQRGATLNTRDQWGKTALAHASAHGYLNVAELLLENGADIDAQDNKGKTALILAVIGDYKNIVKLLLDKGADCTIKDNAGNTAFDRASQRASQISQSIAKLISNYELAKGFLSDEKEPSL